MPATVTTASPSTSEARSLGLLPQWYRGRRNQLPDHPACHRVWDQARAVIPDSPLRIDIQSAHLRPGVSIGVPVWQQTTWAAPHALLICFADDALMEVRSGDDACRRMPPGVPVELCPADQVRFHAAVQEQDVSLVLIRAAGAALLPPRPRVSARVFVPPIPPETAEPIPDAELAALPQLHFESHADIIGRLPHSTAQEVADEPLFRPCPLADARAAGGPLVQRFLQYLPAHWREPGADVLIAARRDEVSPGWNPTRVGFHIDGTSRIPNKRSDGQPNLRNPGRTVEQLLACCGPGSPTRFLLGPVQVPEPPLGERARVVNQQWQRLLMQQVAAGTLRCWQAPADAVVHYGFGGFHTGADSQVPGWRCFLRGFLNRREDETPPFRPIERNSVSWPIEAEDFPGDPCGVFPDDAP